MRFKQKTARLINSMLLGMGGYSFGFELGEFSDQNPFLVGALFSLIFFLHGIMLRRFVDDIEN